MNSKERIDRNAFPQDRTDAQHPPVNLYPGQHLHGFEVKDVTPIDELRAVAIELSHPRSGARLMHLWTDDSRNWFSISPITPTLDDTGLQHILEHSVMAGSRSYPVKEVFLEMMKMSLATFDSTNAMNYIDHAFYYTSNNVKKDLFNVAEVHFDSVFHPLLTEDTFKREGHHLEPVDPDQPTGDLKINGIVYNEVKNNLSAPEACLGFAVTGGLLPDTCYARNGAGNSLVMPDLTYEQLKTYHKTYYHPRNCYFFFYGNIPTSDYLVFLGDKLAAIPKPDTNGFLHPLRPEISHQPKWKSPRTVADTYPIGADEPLTEKTYLMLSWIIGDTTDPEDVILCSILNLILFGNEGAPLRKAIIDSKLGTDIHYNFLSDYTGPNRTFCVGLIGSEADRVDAFTESVINTLTQIADTEIDKEKIEAAFQQITYDYQEVTSNFPFQMMKRVVNTWIYEKEPTLFLKMGTHLSTIRQRWKQNPRIFNELIRERLLDNPHRLTTILSPEPDMQARLDAEEDARLKAIQSQLTDEQMKQIAADAVDLEHLNEQPNSPEDLAKLPQLHVSDLPKKLLYIPTTVEMVGERPLLRNDLFSNGVNYLVLNFDLQGLPQHLWQYLPRYTDAVGKLGAGKMNYEQMAQRAAAATGGLECSPQFSTHALNANHPVWNMQFRLKALDGKIEDALGVLQDLIFAVNPRDKERLYDVLSQAVVGYQNQIHGYSGPSIANHHAACGLSPQAYLSETVFGVSQFRTSEMLLNRFDDSYEELSSSIEQIRDFLLVQGHVTASFTGSDASFEVLQGQFAEWIGNMRDESINPEPTGFRPFDTYPREGLAAPIQIAHCTQAMPAPHYSHPDSVLLTIGSHLLTFDHMLSEIRLKGNAYIGAFTYNPFESLIYQGSQFDPHVDRTLNVFAHTIDYVKQIEWTQSDIDKAIIATASDYQKTIRPGQASTDALTYYLTGQTREIIEERYTQLRRATPKTVKRALLETLEENRDKASICVVASREKLEAENQKMTQPLHIENVFE
ncbi:MAG: insulinase family protein [Candidatus Poribacteria bacterium]|nr:insulinase family protein [Candidatus Poribacteria bacterium]